jgi:hypothetical protein
VTVATKIECARLARELRERGARLLGQGHDVALVLRVEPLHLTVLLPEAEVIAGDTPENAIERRRIDLQLTREAASAVGARKRLIDEVAADGGLRVSGGASEDWRLAPVVEMLVEAVWDLDMLEALDV